MRTFAFLGIAVVAVLTGSIGTITDPELVDSKGDLAYQPTYLGPKDHDQADIESLWIDYDDVADTIAVHLQVPGMTRLENPSPEFSYHCIARFNLTVDGSFNGRMRTSWDRSGPNAEDESRAWYQREADETPTATSEDLLHTFELQLGEPGFYVWRIDRAAVGLRGQRMQDIRADCTATHHPALGAPLTPVGFDDGSGHRAFAVDALVPRDQMPPAESSTTIAPVSSSWSEDAGRTSAFGAGGVLVALGSMAWVRRKR